MIMRHHAKWGSSLGNTAAIEKSFGARWVAHHRSVLEAPKNPPRLPFFRIQESGYLVGIEGLNVLAPPERSNSTAADSQEKDRKIPLTRYCLADGASRAM